MRYILAAIVGAALLYHAFGLGYDSAVKKTPEYQAIRANEAERREVFNRELQASISDRGLVCDEIFATVQELLEQEWREEVEARND